MRFFVLQGLAQGFKEEDLGLCEQRAGRIVQIMRVLVQQFDVLETMQPQGFQDFSESDVLLDGSSLVPVYISLSSPLRRIV